MKYKMLKRIVCIQVTGDDSYSSKAVFSHELGTVLGESGWNIVCSCPFSHVEHNMEVSYLDTFSLLEILCGVWVRSLPAECRKESTKTITLSHSHVSAWVEHHTDLGDGTLKLAASSSNVWKSSGLQIMVENK